MSGGYFTSNYSQMQWLADDLDEYRKIVANQPLEVFEVCEAYQPDFEKNPDLRKFTNDPLSTKHEVLHKIDQIKDLINRACVAARAVDYLASGDYAPDSFLKELADEEKTFGKNWLENEKPEKKNPCPHFYAVRDIEWDTSKWDEEVDGLATGCCIPDLPKEIDELEFDEAKDEDEIQEWLEENYGQGKCYVKQFRVVELEQSRKDELIDGIGGAITYLVVLFWLPLMKWVFG